MKYYIKIFGCQMNHSDAERVSAILAKYKLKQASSIDEANLVIFVTCGVRQSAEDRVYGQINNLRKKYPEKKIILTGCLAHQRDVQRRLKDKVDLFTIIKDFPKKILFVIARNVATKQSRTIQENARLLRYARNDKSDYLKITPRYTNSYTAYIPIMTGCDNFCAYCVVPCARGREYSRPAEDILKEVKHLANKGYKEIILLGQNVNSYYCHPERNLDGLVGMQSRDLHASANSKPLLPHADSSTPLRFGQNDKEIDFPKLLHLIEKIPGRFWITFLTSHPKDMSDELIETIAKSKKICEYISLPAQSGDDAILKKMNRHYSVAHYKKLIKKIRAEFVGVRPQSDTVGGRTPTEKKLPPAISTDIIVGFPGETKNQFENTAKLLREMKFDMAYISQYSPRPETVAWKLKDNVSKKEKARREKVLTKILEKTALENNKKYVGKVVEVLVDRRFDLEEFPDEKSGKGKVEPWREKYLAHTRTQKKVMFSSDKKIPVGNFAKVKITKVKAFGMEGEIKKGRHADSDRDPI